MDKDTIKLTAAIEAMKAFGCYTSSLDTKEFVEACRYTAKQFEELASQQEQLTCAQSS